jgi:hypothetical protein
MSRVGLETATRPATPQEQHHSAVTAEPTPPKPAAARADRQIFDRQAAAPGSIEGKPPSPLSDLSIGELAVLQAKIAAELQARLRDDG